MTRTAAKSHLLRHVELIECACVDLNYHISELVEAVDAGALDQLDVAEKVAFWQRFESLRNRLPLSITG